MLFYRDLPVVPATGVAIYCAAGCNDEGYSASQGDYFMYRSDEPVLCAECGSTMFLGRAVTTIERV